VTDCPQPFVSTDTSVGLLSLSGQPDHELFGSQVDRVLDRAAAIIEQGDGS
jgi:hypothetical protein